MFSRLWARLPRDPLGVPLTDSRVSLRLSRELRTVFAWTRIHMVANPTDMAPHIYEYACKCIHICACI